MISFKWIQRNLFSTWIDSIFTLCFLTITILISTSVVEWAFIEADFRGSDRSACVSGGACWVFIKERINSLLFGFYPSNSIWRLSFIFVLPLILCLKYFIKGLRHPLVTTLIILPIGMSFLIWGGVAGYFPGFQIVPTDRWGGLALTLIVSLVGMSFSLPIGILLALGRRSTFPLLRILSVIFIEFWRGVPLVTVLFMASVMLPLFTPSDFEINKLLRCLIGVSLFSAAYLAEVVRGGLASIPHGQYEASQSLGLRYWQMMGFVILPQALRVSLPAIVNTLVGLLKDTTLVLIVGLFDLLGMIQASMSDPEWLGYSFEGYVFAAIIYWVLCSGLSSLSWRLEKRLSMMER